MSNSLAIAGRVLLAAGSGFGLFLMLLNRVLFRIKDSPYKYPLILLTMALMTIGPGWLAATLPTWPWNWIPIAILGLLVLGEVRRAYLRWSYRAAPPVHETNRGRSLMRPNTTTDLAISHYRIEVPAWRGEPLRILHMGDLHYTHALPSDYYRDVIGRGLAYQPDLVLLTGDWVSRYEEIALLPEILPLLQGQRCYAVLGNHDYWAGAEDVAEQLVQAGIPMLRNTGETLTIRGDTLRLVGDEHPWNRAPVQMPSAKNGQLCVALSHTPDNIYRLNRLGVQVVLSGHCHAGQVQIPLLGPMLVPSNYGRRFDHGHFNVRGTHLFITSGVGAGSPLRLYCQPDLFVVDIRPAQTPHNEVANAV